MELLHPLPLLLLLLLATVTMVTNGQMDQVESQPVDGHQFREGQQFRFVCRATGNQDFALRLLCPLAAYASGSLGTTACFENCGRPLCDHPSQNDCSKTVPELLNTNCSRSVRQLSPTAQEITVEFTFNSASLRHDGSYVCQYKTMRSSVYIIVGASTTSTSTSTTTSTSTSSTTSTTTSTSTASTTTSTTAVRTTAVSPSPSTSLSVASSASSTLASATTTSSSPGKTSQPQSTTGTRSSTATTISTTTASELLTLPPKVWPTRSTRLPDLLATTTELPLRTGWFYSSMAAARRLGSRGGVRELPACVDFLGKAGVL